MPRYIDAEALAEEMGAGCIPILEKGISGVTGDETCIMDYINDAPTADVEPVRHGRWVDGRCSECGVPAIAYKKKLNGLEMRVDTPCCRACGAKMDGEEGTP